LFSRFALKQSIAYLVSGGFWIAVLVWYSEHNFGEVLPGYFRPGRLMFHQFWTALAGNLISPSRGFLVFVPAVFVVAYFLIRYRSFVTQRRLVMMSCIAFIA